ncbi:hypothetical protein [Nodosilinea nodulosa]|uniref:hypothetical protein n=1 Tax=Nodosilinea nodulosa TaxID=416001 RepID=UPI000304702F|nr:hypothetical protein [Nodosilinea nodulosa]
MPLGLQAGLWGLLGGSALLLGAVLGYYTKISRRIIAGIMAFGAGVLISALAFELMDDAYQRDGFDSTAIGFLSGAAIYTLASGASALVGYGLFSQFSAEVIAATLAIAAGAILAMISDTMMPEAFEQAHDFAGLVTVCGFLKAFVLSELGG